MRFALGIAQNMRYKIRIFVKNSTKQILGMYKIISWFVALPSGSTIKCRRWN